MYWVSIWGWQVDIGLIGFVATVFGAIIAILMLILYFVHRCKDKKKEEERKRQLEEQRIEFEARDAQTQTKLDQILQYQDGLPQAEKQVKDPFEDGEEALAKWELDKAIKHFRTALDQATEPTQRSALLIIMGQIENDRGNYDHARGYFREALHIAEEADDIAGKCWALNGLGLVDRKRGKLEEAEKHHHGGIDIAKSGGFDDADEALSAHLGNIGIVLMLKGDLEGALKSYEEALEIDRRIDNPLGEAHDLGDIGVVLMDKGDLDGALKSHKEALKIHRRIGNLHGEAQSLSGIALVLMRKGNLKGALKSHNDSLEIHRRIGNPLSEAQELGNIGNVLILKGDLDKALQSLQDSLEIDSLIGNPLVEASDLNNIAKVFEEKGELKGALKNYEEALVIFHKLGTPREIGIVERNIKRVKEKMAKK